MTEFDENKFVIAYNLSDPAQSEILARSLNQLEAAAFAHETDFADFVGRGIALYDCRTVELIAVADNPAFELLLDEDPTAFELVAVLKAFPLIEGEFVPGIYPFRPRATEFYEIQDLAALTDFWNDEPNFDYKTRKIVCCADGVAIVGLHEAAPAIDSDHRLVKRLPFDCFDSHCPICGAQVLAHRADRESLLCEIVETPCRHSVSQTIWLGSRLVRQTRFGEFSIPNAITRSAQLELASPETAAVQSRTRTRRSDG